MAGEKRAVTKVVVEVFVAVEIVDATAFTVLDKEWIGRIKAIIAAYSYRNTNRCTFVGIARFGSSLFICR